MIRVCSSRSGLNFGRTLFSSEANKKSKSWPPTPSPLAHNTNMAENISVDPFALIKMCLVNLQFSFVLKKIPQATDSHKIFRHFESIAIHTNNSFIQRYRGRIGRWQSS